MKSTSRLNRYDFDGRPDVIRPKVIDDSMDMWDTVRLDEEVAEKVFGWTWVSCIGKPMRINPDYPEAVRIRMFVSPEIMADEKWKEAFANRDGAKSDGTEPMAYCYGDRASCPNFSGHATAIADLEAEIRRRGLWKRYRDQLLVYICRDDVYQYDTGMTTETRLECADWRLRCVATLAVVQSELLDRAESAGTVSP